MKPPKLVQAILKKTQKRVASDTGWLVKTNPFLVVSLASCSSLYQAQPRRHHRRALRPCEDPYAKHHFVRLSSPIE